MKAGLVCIARDEGRFIVEWLAHYLAMGFDPIVVYDHQSSDDTARIIDAISEAWPVSRVHWTVGLDQSPQISAYAHALNALRRDCDWIAFFDVDEFLVIREAGLSLHTWLQSFGSNISAIGVNWLTFGSGGRTNSSYGTVRNAFRTGGPRSWSNNAHIKTVARPEAISRMGIHDCLLRYGQYVNASGQPLLMSRKRGIADSIDHSVAQLNHYQVKSIQDFERKIARGRAGKRGDDPTRIRNNPDDFLRRLDQNSFRYDDIDGSHTHFEEIHHLLLQCVARTVPTEFGR